MCKVLLRNDWWCKGLGQTQPKSEAYEKYKEIKKQRKLGVAMERETVRDSQGGNDNHSERRRVEMCDNQDRRTSDSPRIEVCEPEVVDSAISKQLLLF